MCEGSRIRTGKKFSKNVITGEVQAQLGPMEVSGVSATLQNSCRLKVRELGFCAPVPVSHWL